MCLTMHPIILSAETTTLFHCMICLEPFTTQMAATACAQSDMGDTISKAAAHGRRQANERKRYAFVDLT